MMNRIDDQVEADVELHARVVEGVEAAFVGRDLLGVGIVTAMRNGTTIRTAPIASATPMKIAIGR